MVSPTPMCGMKKLPAVAEMIHANRRTERQTWRSY